MKCCSKKQYFPNLGWRDGILYGIDSSVLAIWDRQENCRQAVVATFHISLQMLFEQIFGREANLHGKQTWETYRKRGIMVMTGF